MAKSAAAKIEMKRKKVSASQLEVLLAARQFLQKKYGQETVVGMDLVENSIPGYVSTQSLAVDWILGNGGLPQSRLIEVFGPEGAGKSTFADHVFAEIQRIGGQAYLWDTENARATTYIDKVGIVRKLASQIDADSMEKGFEVMQDVILWHTQHFPTIPGVIVWDTVASTPTDNELNPDKNAEQFGPAKIIRSRLRKLVHVLRKSRWIVIAVNQEYEQTKNYQTIRKTYGGGGFPYHASVRLSVWPGQKLYGAGGKDSGLPPLGQIVSLRTVKNKVFPPWRSTEACIVYGEGIDNVYSVFHTLLGAGMIEQGGGWYRLKWPEVEKKYPAWQTGFWGLKALIRENSDLWPILLNAYRQVQVI